MSKAAVDGAQTHTNVFVGLYLGGGRLRVFICQGVYHNVGVVFFDILCNFVNKGDPNTRVVAAVFLCDFCAVGTIAGLLIVGL